MELQVKEQGIYKAILAVMSDIDSIGKDRKNESQGYKFRGIDDVYNTAHALFAKHGIFTTACILEDRHEERTNQRGTTLIYRVLKVRYTFHHIDGSHVQTEVIGEGMDSGDKASNKAMAVAHKYAILQIFLVPTEEPKDPEVDHHEVAPRKAKPDPVQTAADVFEADPYQVARDRVVKDIQALVGKPGEKDAWPETEKASLKLKELITEASQTKNADLLAVALERAKAFARLRTQGNNDATIKAILACPDVTRLAELGVV